MARNGYIDRLRGLSALSVVLLHYAMFCQQSLVSFWHGFGNGNYGVMVFFVISGFLITTTIIKRWGEPAAINLPAFYRMRAARILPGLLLLVSLLISLHYAGAPPFIAPSGKSVWMSAFYALTFRYHWLMFYDNGPGMYAWGPIWSLSVEELFYLMFPLVCIATRRRIALVVIGAALMAIGPYFRASPIIGAYGFFGALDCLALGCMVALLVDEVQPLPRWIAWGLRAVGLLGLLAIYQFTQFNASPFMPFAISGIALCTAVYILGSHAEQPAFGYLDGALQHLGRFSYEIYLLHLPIILGFAALWPPLRGLDPAHLAVCLATICLIATTVGLGITEPLNRFLRGAQSNVLATVS